MIIGPDAHVRGVDIYTNQLEVGQHCEEERFFVTTLTFVDADGRYDMNGRDAHFCNTNAAPGQILGDPFCE